MKNLSVFLLLLFINCVSQQKITDKKYMDMENLLQKYREIRTEYNALVEKNKDSLVYIDRSEDGLTLYGEGMYYKKSIYEKEKKKKQAFERLDSKSKLLLKQDNKEIFVANYSGGKTIYVYDNDNIIEKTNISNDDSGLQVENFVDNIYINHSVENSETEIYNLKLDNDGARETTLYRKYKNDVLLLERNYEKDFKISKEQILKKLPDNFYESVIQYTEGDEFKKIVRENSISKIMLDNFFESIKTKKKDIEVAIKDKNDLYKHIEISKYYDENGFPFYEVRIPDWKMKINPKNNKVIDVKRIISMD